MILAGVTPDCRGGSRGGGPFGGPPNFIKREKNVAHVCAKTLHFRTYQLPGLPPPPSPKSWIRPWIDQTDLLWVHFYLTTSLGTHPLPIYIFMNIESPCQEATWHALQLHAPTFEKSWICVCNLYPHSWSHLITHSLSDNSHHLPLFLDYFSNQITKISISE